MKLFLIIIVLAFIVFAVSIHLGWHFTRAIHKVNESIESEKYYADHDEWWY